VQVACSRWQQFHQHDKDAWTTYFFSSDQN
jgi:hypothetical protein